MDAPTTAQTTYYVIATIGVLVATVINLILVNRNKPDKIKAAVNAAVHPLVMRLDEVETVQQTQGEQLDEQDVTLATIKSDIQHAPSRNDINTLHHRINEAKNVGMESKAIGMETRALTKALQGQVSQLSAFLMGRGNG